jgi:hypothetical protein
VLANAAGGLFTLTLPAASAAAGSVIHIKKSDATGNQVSVAAGGSDTIEGVVSVKLLAQYKSYTLWSDGVSKWYILALT